MPFAINAVSHRTCNQIPHRLIDNATRLTEETNLLALGRNQFSVCWWKLVRANQCSGDTGRSMLVFCITQHRRIGDTKLLANQGVNGIVLVSKCTTLQRQDFKRLTLTVPRSRQTHQRGSICCPHRVGLQTMTNRQCLQVLGQLLPSIGSQHFLNVPVDVQTTTRRNNATWRQSGLLNECHQAFNSSLLRMVLVEFFQVLTILFLLLVRQRIDSLVFVRPKAHHTNRFYPFVRNWFGYVQVNPQRLDANNVLDRARRVTVLVDNGFVGITRSGIPDILAVTN